MKQISVFGLQSHQTIDRTSGVDFARIIQPLKALDGYEYKNYQFKTKVFDLHTDVNKINWLDVAKLYDIIFLNYIIDPWGYAAMGAMARGHKRKIVMDLDDALWYVRADNPSASAYKTNGENIHNLECMLNDVDAITVTNDFLRNVVIAKTDKTHDNIHVLDNYIDLEHMYTNKPDFKDTRDIRLLHHGSTTHFEDLSNDAFSRGVDMIMKEYPNVTIEFVGAFLPKYKNKWGMRYLDSFGHQDIYKWVHERFPQVMKQTDILVAPLSDNIYTRCKSGIKFLETSAMGKPGVYQNMEQYRKYVRHGTNGFLASTPEDWYVSLKTLIDDKEKRRSVAEEAYKTVTKETIQENINKYAQMFVNVLS